MAATWARRWSAGCSPRGWATAGELVGRRGRRRPARSSWPTCSPASRPSPTAPPCDGGADRREAGRRARRGRAPRSLPGRARILSIAAGVSLGHAGGRGRRRRRRRAGDAEHAGARRSRAPRRSAPARRPPTTTSTGPRRSSASVGTVVRVPESQLDAVTGLAGSGPAYLFLVAEALIDAGVLAGLARPVAEALVRQLLVGSAALLAERGDPAALRAMVTSPGRHHGRRAARARAARRARRVPRCGRWRPRRAVASSAHRDADATVRDVAQRNSDVTLFSSSRSARNLHETRRGSSA